VEFRHRGIEGFPPGVDDNGPLGAQPIQVEADSLPDAPFDAITHHGFADRARKGEADVGTGGFVFAHTKRREERSGDANPLVVNPSKILGSENANTFGKAWDENYLSSLTVSFLRPAARRRERTARPFLVSMRERKPCVFAR
jgi:hypothetical protein